MGLIKNLSRLGVVLGSLGVIAVTFAGTARASIAMFPVPGGSDATTGTDPVRSPSPVIHTVVMGGMPGWQIAMIAIVAALVTAVAAVLADRTRSARRRLLSTRA